ncbi:MAG: hypothetical protein KA234_01130 [Saprospiraceae bacterium]|nr:hypothetical protein [Saprospiraceae bacterium]
MKIGLSAKIGFCLIALKLIGLISWSWIIILAPFWVMWMLGLILYFIVGNFINEDSDDEEL